MLAFTRRLPALAPFARPFVRALATKGGVVPVPKAPAAPKDLHTLLQNEIRFEKEDASAFEKVEELRASLSKWTVVDEQGSSRVTLTSADGRVAIDLDVTPISEPQYDDDEEDEEEGEGGEEGGDEEEDEDGEGDGYRMLVTIKGKDQALRFGCMIKDYLKVHRVTTHPIGKLPPVNSTFVGEEDGNYAPNFDELDQKLQNGFYEFLAKCVPFGAPLKQQLRFRAAKKQPPTPPPRRHGIDDEVCGELADYCAAKEQKEYVTWLETAAKAVKG
jgi:hypothetical protein